MAYDQNSAYEPPRRAYFDSRQPQPNPGYSSHAGYGQEPYDQSYDQGYGYGYQQQNGGYDYSYDQTMNGTQGQYYDHGPRAEYHTPAPNYDPQYARPEERSYDPRYQQRSQRGPPPPHPAARPARGGYGPPGRGAVHQGDPRGALPRQNGYSPQRPADQYVSHNGYPPPSGKMMAPPQSAEQYVGSAPVSRNPHPNHAQPQQPSQSQGKRSMEDWKAAEKAKMKQDAQSPESLPFDNAFPVFGKKKNDRAAEQTGRSNSQPETHNQELGRPSTSGDSRMPYEDGNRARGNLHPPQRPDVDRQHSAPEARWQETHADQQQVTHDRRPPDQWQPIHAPQVEEQWPITNAQAPSQPPSSRTSPSRTNGQYPSYPSNEATHRAPNMQYQHTYDQHPQAPRQTAPRQGQPPLRPIDTRQTGQQQRHMYMDHQPLSPTNLPQRPSTSQGQRPEQEQNTAGTQAYHNLASTPHEQYDGHALHRPQQVARQDQSRYGSLDDIYDGYGNPPAQQMKRAPTNREEEIEAEMPDFDSAAPGQTSVLHKRNQTVDKHLNDPQPASQLPPMPRTQTAPPSSMPQSQSTGNLHQGSHTLPPQFASRPASGPSAGPQDRIAAERGMALAGYNGGTAPGPSRSERQYGIAYQNGPQSLAAQHGVPLPPPQAPFANEPQVRRSMDDARQMPYRQGPPPPQPRPHANGAVPRGPLPTGQRPDQRRNPGTNQAMWPGISQARGESAPPSRHGLSAPPSNATDTPSNQQRPSSETNPDALPRHPTPVRAGLLQQGQSQPNKPPPFRSHTSNSSTQSSAQQHQRHASLDHFAQPVTPAELERLRAAVDATPNNSKQALLLVRKLVEAASILATENGRVDAKTAAKNRERYLNEAYKRLKKLVATGYPDAQFYLADCHGQGTMGLEVDTKEAFKLYQAAAKAGHAQAAYRTAVCCEMGPEEGGGTSRDYPKAVQWYRRAASLGDSAAMYKLGAVLLKGLLGQQRNITEAVIWLKRGAERADKDNPHALHELATLYESTNTNPEVRNKVVADDGYARDLFQQAAKLGYKFSQFRLGQAYEYGNLGLTIDNRTSIAWYTKAASQGEHQAELALSGWYLTGAEGILEHSDTEAYLWARKAAMSEPPLAKAMFAMGYFTENGIGCPASFEEAKKWYGRAASYKFPKAVERLEEMKKGGKPGKPPPPAHGKLTRKDQKRDEENCVVM